MNLERILANDEERAGRRLIEQAGIILTGLRGDMPDGFADRLFAHASYEDMGRYEARELAALAEDAWAFVQTRKPGTPKIRIESRQGPIGAQHIAGVSVIEILNDNMPFLLDSIMADLTEHGADIRFVVHPIFTVERDLHGEMTAFKNDAAASGKAIRESFIHIHIDRIEEPSRQREIIERLEQVLADVRVCVTDWRAMLARVSEAIQELKDHPPPVPADDISEAVAFIEWLIANNFTLLGVRDYEYEVDAGEIEPKMETGLGILRGEDVRVLRRGTELVSMTPEIIAFLKEPSPLIIVKANVRSRVHRRVHMDYIGVKRFRNGRLIGETRIVGLFTSTAYTRSIRSIPYLRRKVDAVLRRARFDPDSHSGKALVNVLETYPRDELIQVDEETLYAFALTIMHLDERPRVRVLPRRDRFDRFVSVLVFVPRERYDSAARIAIGNFLAQAYDGRISAFYPYFSEGPLVRVHYIIGRDAGETPNPDRAGLEDAVASIVRTWNDGLQDALTLVHDQERARLLIDHYRDAFSAAYRESYPPSLAVGDIRIIENLSPTRPLGVDFHRREATELNRSRLKVWSREHPLLLSDRVPVLENMGFRVIDERTYRVEPKDSVVMWLHDMTIERQAGGAIAVDGLNQQLEACFFAVMRGRAENDGYNALVLAAGISWREVAAIRTLSRFLRQARIAYSQDYMWATLVKHAGIAAQIVTLFHTRLDPRLELSAPAREAQENAIQSEIETALDKVENLDEDRILRAFVSTVRAALRTNYYQSEPGGQRKAVIAIKFASRELDFLPLPRPLYEIFVYSPRVEGVHLRFGKVARGGIRWSDRPQDFRTEVLGLVKAQQVKNAVIVPVGAKGGFLPKHLPQGGSREAIQAEGTAAYQVFVSTLLDITDNLTGAGLSAPKDVVRHDGDDPYLVVAADKGTATFSDIANSISLERGFWLGDAFASGGSAGYDHKKMGITARGAWEAVKRHFREIDVDIQTTPFTVAGVGDMSGDVFGNGMLLSSAIKLVAAFDHRDIFIDPDPQPERSLAERGRLFGLPRSSWRDYDKSLISAGGGVYARTAKEITLSEQARALLGIEETKVSPQRVMIAILKLNADLLWFGGIGTYVRASSETDDRAGDRANDAIRIAASELHCKVIGEGANLAMTQRARIEAAGRGVRLNTDAIDNSAGVNTSDLEVNIKIALSIPVAEGRLNQPARLETLSGMTDDVASLVLRNNYLQTLALSLTLRRGLEDLGFEQRLMQALEGRGLLDRNVEFLPSDMELGERARKGQSLTRPELAVLLAYAKLTLFDDLLESGVPDDPYLGRELGRYFPKHLSEHFPDALEKHRLRREIIATHLANSMINRGGPSLIVRIADQTGASVAQIAAAFAAVRDAYQMTSLNGDIDALDNKVSGALQLELYTLVQDLLLDRLIWFIRNVDFAPGLSNIVDHFRNGISEAEALLEEVLSLDAKNKIAARTKELTQAGIPDELARKLALLPTLGAAPDIITISDRTKRPLPDVAATYFTTGDYFRIDRLFRDARSVESRDYFDRLALDRALSSIAAAERRLVAEMVADGATGQNALEHWLGKRGPDVPRIRDAVHEIAGSGLTISKLSVAASLLTDLVKD